MVFLATAGPGLAAEPQQAPPGAEGVAPPLAISTTPVPPPSGPAAEDVSEPHRLNLWPLLTYRRDPHRKTTEFNLLGPIFRTMETPKEKSVALSPFFFSLTDKTTGDVVSEFLWPYGSYKRRGGEERTHLAPIFRSEKGESPSFELFPIYGGRSSKGEAYGGVFPFGGTIKERFGQDEGAFYLFPLYAQSRRDETTTTHVLWPFFSSTSGPRVEGFKAWPFFGWRTEEGHQESSFVLWPFWTARRSSLDSDNPENFWMFFPIYGQTTSPARDSWVALWPFFNFAKDKEHDYSTFSLFPLLSVTQGTDREAFKLIPLFGYEKTQSTESSFIIAPFIYDTKKLQARGYTEERVRWLLFSRDDRRTWTEEGETSQLTHVWPFYHYQKSRAGAVKVAFPSVFPYVSEGFQRNWPFLTLYDYQRDEAGWVRSSVLWNFITYEGDAHSSSTEVAFLMAFSSDEAAGAKEFSLLNGLLGYRRTGDRRRYSFLYIPWEVGGRPAEPPAPATVAAKESRAPAPATVAARKARPPEPIPPPESKPRLRQRIIFESIR